MATAQDHSLIFTNLVDFDEKFGHRRNPVGYAKALKEFDDYLPTILEQLKPDDLLMITADHGCDPTFQGQSTLVSMCQLLLISQE